MTSNCPSSWTMVTDSLSADGCMISAPWLGLRSLTFSQMDKVSSLCQLQRGSDLLLCFSSRYDLCSVAGAGSFAFSLAVGRGIVFVPAHAIRICCSCLWRKCLLCRVAPGLDGCCRTTVFVLSSDKVDTALWPTGTPPRHNCKSLPKPELAARHDD